MVQNCELFHLQVTDGGRTEGRTEKLTYIQIDRQMDSHSDYSARLWVAQYQVRTTKTHPPCSFRLFADYTLNKEPNYPHAIAHMTPLISDLYIRSVCLFLDLRSECACVL